MIFFWGGGYEDFVIFGVYHKIGLYLRVISMHFTVFPFAKGTEWGIFLGVAKIPSIFSGYLEFLKLFG